MSRYVTPETHDPRDRFALYRLCDCSTCEGAGQLYVWENRRADKRERCSDCRGEGRIRQEVAACETAEAVGVALVTLAREGEFEECPFGLLDRMPECDMCSGVGTLTASDGPGFPLTALCQKCQGSGVKPTGTWLITPWLPSPRNVSDAGRVLGSARKKTHSSE